MRNRSGTRSWSAGYDDDNLFQVIDVSVEALTAEPDGAHARCCYMGEEEDDDTDLGDRVDAVHVAD